MEVIVERPAALDVHNATVMACVRVPGSGRRRAEHVAEFLARIHRSAGRDRSGRRVRVLELGAGSVGGVIGAC